MNRRDVMKTAAAAAALPGALMASAREAFAARRAEWGSFPVARPIPVYTYDSRDHRMTLRCADEQTRAMQAYLRR